MKVTNRLFACFIVFLLTFNVCAFEKDISGNYQCSGYDPFKKANYKGEMTVSKTQDTYHFIWLYDENFTVSGTGILDKSSKNSIAIVFTSPSCPKHTGVQIYHLKNDGSLYGDWTLLGENQVSAENCKKIS